jgi:hypothetical protein
MPSLTARRAAMEAIRLFPSIQAGGQPSTAAELYRNFWEADPDSYQKTPVGTLAFAPSVAQGTYKGLRAVCSVQPLRIDLTLALLQTELITDSLPMIEDARLFHEELLHVCSVVAHISLNVAVSRVACAVQFGSEAPDFEAANKLIMSALPERYRLALSDEADFILQINHPRNSAALDELRINLIRRWSVERMQTLTIGASANLGVIGLAPSSAPMIKEFLVAAVLFDHNNIPAPRAISAEEQSRVLIETFRAVSDAQRDCNLAIEGF